MEKIQASRKVVVTKDGPYLVSGNIPLAKENIMVDGEGYPVKWAKGTKYPYQESYELCRCGKSTTKPYCSEMHAKIGFDGTETASRKKYVQRAEKITGPELVLGDAIDLCSSARFCDRAGGVWRLTEESDYKRSKKIAIDEACNCPSGRLVASNRKTGKPIEPELNPSISVVEDPDAKASGPLWLKGGVVLESSDGSKYETRNRVTLCRCGKSENKPFCDGTHTVIGFRD